MCDQPCSPGSRGKLPSNSCLPARQKNWRPCWISGAWDSGCAREKVGVIEQTLNSRGGCLEKGWNSSESLRILSVLLGCSTPSLPVSVLPRVSDSVPPTCTQRTAQVSLLSIGSLKNFSNGSDNIRHFSIISEQCTREGNYLDSQWGIIACCWVFWKPFPLV